MLSVLVEGLEIHEVLHKRWNMDEPNITYFTGNNTFVLDFPTASPNNTLEGMQYEFYDFNCKYDGSNFTEYIIPNGIFGPDGVSAPQMTLDGAGGLPQLQFKIDPELLSRDEKIYTEIDASMVNDRRKLDGGGYVGSSGGGDGTYTGGGSNNAGATGAEVTVGDLFGNGTNTTNNSSTCPAYDGRRRRLTEDSSEPYDYDVNDIGKGVMRMCVRSSLGYPKNATYFREVNFIESIIYVFYDLTAGFCVEHILLEAKNKLITSVEKDAYQLEAWLCDRSKPFVPRAYSDRSLPAPVNATYLASFVGATNTTFFTQGSVVSVCVAPEDYAYNEGIRMNGINSFTWKRNEPALTPPLVTQLAIFNRTVASNLLTFYPAVECEGESEFCHFHSLLFADFYLTPGTVYGEGTATMTFASSRRSRRLGASDEELSPRRFLQESDARSVIDVSVPVVSSDDSPINLKTTAGGFSSFGFRALISMVSLFGGTLLLA